MRLVGFDSVGREEPAYWGRLDSRQIVFDAHGEISVVVIRSLLQQHFRELPSLPGVAEGSAFRRAQRSLSDAFGSHWRTFACSMPNCTNSGEWVMARVPHCSISHSEHPQLGTDRFFDERRGHKMCS